MYTPDLFAGRTFQSIDEGLGYIGEIGFDEMRERGVRVADELPPELVYAGLSFGVLPAQKLAQTRPGSRGALLFSSCLPIRGEWAFGSWPDGVAVQIPGMDNDPIRSAQGPASRPCVESRAPGMTDPAASKAVDESRVNHLSGIEPSAPSQS